MFSFNSEVYTKEEQKMSTTAREFFGVFSTLQTKEYYKIGSPHTVYLYTDHISVLSACGRRGKISQQLACHLTIPQT